MHRLEYIKEALETYVETELSDLRSVDSRELGEVIDMIKDLEESIYYCTITKAMKEKDEGRYSRDYDRKDGRMYYDGGRSYMRYEEPYRAKDWREGRSPSIRKSYIEAKEMHHGKEAQLRELEAYMQELAGDMTEMMQDASPEEKQLLQKKLTGLVDRLK